MFETGTQMAEFGPPEYGQGGYGRRGWRRRARWAGEGEAGVYGPAEYGPVGYGQGEEEYGPAGYGQSEEQFLPAILPALKGVLSGVLGGLLREGEGEYGPTGYGQGEEEGWTGESEGEDGEAEEQFLDRIFVRFLGREAEYDEAALPPGQQAEIAARLMEVSDEEELARILGGIVNTIGRAVQGISGAANSPQGRAFINAATPLARAVLPGAPVPPARCSRPSRPRWTRSSSTSRRPAASSSWLRRPRGPWRRHRPAPRPTS